jgi:hypothetical protein
MRLFSNNFTRLHAYVAGGLFLVFALLSIYCCLRMSVPPGTTVVAALAIVSGPFTSGLIRPGVRDRWQFALTTLPFFAPFIGMGTVLQVLRLPLGRDDGVRVFHICTWMLGLLVWFGGAILSLLCAFD